MHGESFIGVSLDDMRDIRESSAPQANLCIKAFTQNVNNDIITNDYIVNENKTIYKILPNTKLKDFVSKITANGTITVVNENNLEISEEQYVGTGMKLKINGNNAYTLIVTGDLNGDGEIGIVDVGFVKQHILEQRILTTPFLEASDVNYNGRNSDIADFGILLDIYLGIKNNIGG